MLKEMTIEELKSSLEFNRDHETRLRHSVLQDEEDLYKLNSTIEGIEEEILRRSNGYQEHTFNLKIICNQDRNVIEMIIGELFNDNEWGGGIKVEDGSQHSKQFI